MGIVAKLLSFTRTVSQGAKVTDVKFHQGGGYNLTGHHYSSPGDDSYPLPTDYVYTAPFDRIGGYVAISYLDPLVEHKATEGDKRIYARDSSGAAIVDVWLKSDGSCVIENENGSLTLKVDGNVEATGSIIAPSMIVNGKELAEHDHPISGGSSAPGPTGPNNA